MNKVNCLKCKICSKLYFYPKVDKKIFKIKKCFDEVDNICNKKKKC